MEPLWCLDRVRAEVTAIFNYNMRLATATGLFPNAEYHELGRTAHKES